MTASARPRRPRPPAVTFTADALVRLRAALTDKSPEAGVRVGVKKGGCAGMEYIFDVVDGPDAGDEVIDSDGIRVFIAPTALLFVLGAEIDYVTEALSSRFVFNNPNQTDACGCGESVTLQAVPPPAK